MRCCCRTGCQRILTNAHESSSSIDGLEFDAIRTIALELCVLPEKDFTCTQLFSLIRKEKEKRAETEETADQNMCDCHVSCRRSVDSFSTENDKKPFAVIQDLVRLRKITRAMHVIRCEHYLDLLLADADKQKIDKPTKLVVSSRASSRRAETLPSSSSSSTAAAIPSRGASSKPVVSSRASPRRALSSSSSTSVPFILDETVLD